MFLIYSLPYFTLIDISSTHFYIASIVSMKLNITAKCTVSVISVVSPLGQSTRVNKVFKRILLETQEVVFMADLMELSFGDFDLILGMDWFVEHRVSLDCATKRVILRTDGDSEIVMVEECRDYFTNVISTLVTENLVRKRCKAYLAVISKSAFAKLTVNDIRIIK